MTGFITGFTWLQFPHLSTFSDDAREQFSHLEKLSRILHPCLRSEDAKTWDLEEAWYGLVCKKSLLESIGLVKICQKGQV